MKTCLIIPHYNHHAEFIDFFPQAQSLNLPCIIVDDGSSSESVAIIKKLTSGIDNVHFFEHTHNRGKGIAVQTAIQQASHLGFSHAIQIDADGQHDINDVANFIAASERNPDHIICGNPVFDETAPKARLYGRKITDFWVAIETLSFSLKDSLCGFRLYPVQAFEKVSDQYYIGPRMDFDADILVKSYWAGIPIKFIDTKVKYIDDGVSHFNYVNDNLTLIKLHTRLMLSLIHI